MISQAWDEAHLVTGENGLSGEGKQITEIIDSLEELDDDDLAAIIESEKFGFLAPTDILIESDPVDGVDLEPIDDAVHDVSSEFKELPMDFNEIENINDVISEQSNSQLESIIQSLKDIW